MGRMVGEIFQEEILKEDEGLPVSMGGGGSNAQPVEDSLDDWLILEETMAKMELKELKSEVSGGPLS